MPEARIGVIGGSGLYQIEGLTEVEEFYPDTPRGKPSYAMTIGTLEGQRVAFLPRHGRGHRISPTDLPFQANIYAMKMLGVRWLISVSAVGSMREEIAPLDLVVPDQLFDRTVLRSRSFFESRAGTAGIVTHIAFAEPFSKPLSQMLFEAAQHSGAKVHKGGTYICIEGPQFSTRAESTIYRQWGIHIIGMTALPEARLAREAEMHYAVLACATDYDSWHESHESVTVEMVVNNLNQNVARSKATLKTVVPLIAKFDQTDYQDECDNALATAIMTDRSRVPAEALEKLGLIVKRYF
jgi:5'-methylthioadenosine phosphorylase